MAKQGKQQPKAGRKPATKSGKARAGEDGADKVTAALADAMLATIETQFGERLDKAGKARVREQLEGLAKASATAGDGPRNTSTAWSTGSASAPAITSSPRSDALRASSRCACRSGPRRAT